jgi:hypothetical protein
MAAAPGHFAVVQRCGRTGCHKLALALYRVSLGRRLRAHLVGVVRLGGRDEGSVREALSRFPQLSDDDTEALLEVARLLTPLAPPAA